MMKKFRLEVHMPEGDLIQEGPAIKILAAAYEHRISGHIIAVLQSLVRADIEHDGCIFLLRSPEVEIYLYTQPLLCLVPKREENPPTKKDNRAA